MKRKIVLALAVISICIPAFFMYSIVSKINNEGFDRVELLGNVQQAKISRQQLIPREEITDYLVDDGLIFILYQDNCMVNVYSTEGEYQYSIHYGDITQNGRAYIGYSQGKLHILARSSRIYTFIGTTYSGCLPLVPSSSLGAKLSTLCEENMDREYAGASYHVQNNSITCINKGSTETVISFPKFNDDVKGDILLLPIAIGIPAVLFEKYRYMSPPKK